MQGLCRLERWREASVAVSLATDAPRPSVRIGFSRWIDPRTGTCSTVSVPGFRSKGTGRNGSWTSGRISGGSVEGRSINRVTD